MRRKLVTEIISLSLIFLFVYAAASKLMDVEKFRAEIGESPLLTNVAWLAAFAVPIIEIIVAVSLAIPRYRGAGLRCSFALMVMFTTYIIAILQFTEKIPCSCGGVLERLTWNEHLVFNVVFIVLAIVGVVFHSQDENVTPNRVFP